MKMKIKRSLALVFSLALLFSALLPLTASAAEPVDSPLQNRYISINGKTVFSGFYAANDLEQPSTYVMPAGVAYDYKTNTMTLTNANINVLRYSARYRSLDTSEWKFRPDDTPLNLVLVGKNSIGAARIPDDEFDEAPDFLYALYANGNVNISGKGSLLVTNNHVDGMSGITALIRGKLDIQSGAVEMNNYSGDVLCAYDGLSVNVGAGASLVSYVNGIPGYGSAIEVGAKNGLKISGRAVITTGLSKADAEAVVRVPMGNSYYADTRTDYFSGRAIGRVRYSYDSYVAIQSMAKSIKAKAAKRTLNAGTTYTVVPVSRVKGIPAGICTFTSNNRKVATVDKETGEVTALAKGRAVITIRQANGARAKCTITVR